MKQVEEVGPDPELAVCLRAIESRLDRGGSYHWTTDDFQVLAEAIAEKTGIWLSVTTLKRVWGKVKYTSSPSAQTLNTLARFLDYRDWRSFQRDRAVRHSELPATAGSIPDNDGHYPISPPGPELPPWKKKVRPPGSDSADIPWPFILILMAIGLLAAFLPRSERGIAVSPEHFRFESRPVAAGVPNSVIFSYDAAAAGPDARVEIQQNWDERRRQTVHFADSVATSIYYQPGCYEAKLLVDDQIVAEHTVLVPSDGWLGLIHRKDGIPIYLPEAEIYREGKLSVVPEQLTEKGFDPAATDQWVSLQLVRDFGELPLRDFQMETTLSSAFGEGGASCRGAEIILLFSGKAIIVPLSIPGCVADLRLWVLEREYEGSNTDLSAFGADMERGVNVAVRVKDERLSITVDGSTAWEMPLDGFLDRNFSGVRYRFLGAGSVESLRVKGVEDLLVRIEHLGLSPSSSER